MAGQSSSHHEERRHRSDREGRERGSSTHHSRTISSTTLLLVLSLVLAVLAVMLSLPSGGTAAAGAEGGTASGGIGGLLNPKRGGALLAREGEVARREAEVARREAEILVGAPGGVIPPQLACPPCNVPTVIETVMPPAQTIIQEVVKEASLTPPGWSTPRIEDIIERELKIAEREREISKREEQVNRREHDSSRREAWIMEQLVALGNEAPQAAVEEEYVYEPVGAPKRKGKVPPPTPPRRFELCDEGGFKERFASPFQELPPIVVNEYEYGYGAQTKTIIQEATVPAPAPASTRLAAYPTPDLATSLKTDSSPRTTAVEIVREESPRTIVRPPARRAKPFVGGW